MILGLSGATAMRGELLLGAGENKRGVVPRNRPDSSRRPDGRLMAPRSSVTRQQVISGAVQSQRRLARTAPVFDRKLWRGRESSPAAPIAKSFCLAPAQTARA